MSLFHKDLQSITDEDLFSLIQNGVREGRGIEYKEALPGNSDDDKREFLSDISSFANAAGGDVLYGIKEKRDSSGVTTEDPEALMPLEVNVDAVTLQLYEMAQTGIDPRIPGLRIGADSLKSKGHAIIIRIPKSCAGLHMVTYKNLSRFFSRNSSGKYQLDVHEIRMGFVTVEAGHQRLNAFRLERLTRITAHEGPVHLGEGPKVVLHLIPLSSLDPSITWDLSEIYNKYSLRPPYSIGGNHRHNFDGVLSYSPGSGANVRSYAQLFRNGTIEGCTGELFVTDRRKLIASQVFEKSIIDSTRSY